ncbi:DUF3349 domain-containing protein [Nocardia sp. 348MFTsu5.1]|uniref:DUF3349 domain-containing protein n=1 Tax=Nocardia sp. 348MFTsu5.1 TaxID=1172185 RepID=UPI00036AF9AB|nr:DUF3349 domain-containing protein [Nocardia sp. 348MFTsu5.1]
MDRPQFLTKVVSWLREGYPNGVPSSDYQPLFALLRRQLSEEEVTSVSHELIKSGQMTDNRPEPITSIDAGVLITKITDELPLEADVERIRKHLESMGWPFDPAPLTDPDDNSETGD